MSFVSTKEAAQALGLSERELRRGYREGIYPGIAVGPCGGRLRFSVEQVKAAISERAERGVTWRADVEQQLRLVRGA